MIRVKRVQVMPATTTAWRDDNEMFDNVVLRCKPVRHVGRVSDAACLTVTFTAHFHRRHLLRGECPSGLSAAAFVQGFQIYQCCRPSPTLHKLQPCVYCTISTTQFL